ncbi:ester cyclase [Peribacillus muralis]|uniref:ester cyclase n=1 Tax=Peribacillus muralis TaxID=264697 RepID=UPI00367306D5
MVTNTLADQIKDYSKKIKNIELIGKSETVEFVKNYTALTYDYQMVGMIYDYYKEDVEVLKENRIRLRGIDELVHDRQVLLAAFPDLRTKIENIIVSGDEEKGYKVFRRMRYEGTNTGYSPYGPPTGKELGNECLGLSMFYLNKLDGKWKITYEMDMRSAEWMKEVMTNKLN